MKRLMTEALRLGGFWLIKWASNHEAVLIESDEEFENYMRNHNLEMDVDDEISDADVTSMAPKEDVATTEKNCLKSEVRSEDDVKKTVKVQLGDAQTVHDETSPIHAVESERPQVTTTEQASDISFEDPNDTFEYPDNFEGDFKNMVHPPESSEGKILGVGYDFKTDDFFIRITDKAKKQIRTKRNMSSITASVFDPLGLVSPFVLVGKMILQRQHKLDWNNPVSPEDQKAFQEWQDSMSELTKIRIPRLTTALGFEDSIAKLCVFTDASLTGYGTTVYIRRSLKGGGTGAHVALLLSKSHVVPAQMMKSVSKALAAGRIEDHGDSIPRLEIHACRLGAIMRDMVVRQSGENFEEKIMFTDSTTALNWIDDWDTRFKTFVNFRLKAIHALTDTSEWRHTEGKDNTADLCSRGLKADDPKWDFFYSGPWWLKEEESQWPPHRPAGAPKKSADKMYEEADVTPISLMNVAATEVYPEVAIDVVEGVPLEDWTLRITNKQDDWMKKLRRIAFFKSFLLSLKHYLSEKTKGKKVKLSKEDLSLSYASLMNAEMLLVKSIQHTHFESEIITLLKLGVLSPNAMKELKSKSSRLIYMSPFLDQNNVLRVGGRLGKSTHLTYDMKFPRILPNKDPHVKSLIRYEHERDLHSSKIQTYYTIRSRWFILGGRTTINNVLSKCIKCQRFDKPPQPQREADLPQARLDSSIPYEVCGIDCFGPFGVKYGGRATHKRWVLIITDFFSRGVVLLPLRDMRSQTFINALRRFHSHFDTIVQTIYADNGSNFKGAARELDTAVKEWNREQVAEDLLVKGIIFKWGPANCGHWMGLAERLVGMAKRQIKLMLGTKEHDLDVFETTLAEVAGIMNRRPLTYISADPNDPQVLSPNSLLFPYGQIRHYDNLLPPTPASGDQLRSAWREVRRNAENFWSKYQKEYLDTLRKKTKWIASSKCPYVGQIVLLVEESPREKWRTGIVTELLGDDPNHIRRVNVKLTNGNILERHVVKIVPLEVDLE